MEVRINTALEIELAVLKKDMAAAQPCKWLKLLSSFFCSETSPAHCSPCCLVIWQGLGHFGLLSLSPVEVLVKEGRERGKRRREGAKRRSKVKDWRKGRKGAKRR